MAVCKNQNMWFSTGIVQVWVFPVINVDVSAVWVCTSIQLFQDLVHRGEADDYLWVSYPLSRQIKEYIVPRVKSGPDEY